MVNVRKPESMYIKGICVVCEKNGQMSKGKKEGKTTYRASCYSCHRRKYNQKTYKQRNGNTKYAKFKKAVCEECDFIPKHPCQLDVDHTDGNHDNNHPDNLKTLCANCHRLKTYQNKDWEPTLK